MSVQVVLSSIMSLWDKIYRFVGKELSLKRCMLSALSTLSRDSGIHHLDIRFMVNTGNKITFHFHKLHKAGGNGNLYLL